MSGGFASFGLGPGVLSAVEEVGYVLPTEVQDEAIPLILGGGDVMVAAPTGSGKTAAFALPIVELVAESRAVPPAPPKEDAPVALVDRDGCVSVSASGLSVQSRAAKRFAGARASYGCRGGKHYYEVVIEDEGIVRVGWSTKDASLDLGTDAKGYGYGGTGKRAFDGNFDDFGEPFSKGDVIGCYLDLTRRRMAFSKNGRTFDEDIAIEEEEEDTVFFPTVSLKNAQCSVRFLQTSSGDYGAIDPRGEDVVPLEKAAATTGTKKKRPCDKAGVAAIVLEPARDLAEQTKDAFDSYAANVEVECRLLIGGIDCKKAERDCHHGDVDVVVGTPRKILDCVKRKILDVSSTRFVVLDEADRYAETKEDADMVLEIFSHLDAKRDGVDRLQVCFFSATLHTDAVKALADKVCKNPTWVDLKGKAHLPENVKHLVVDVSPQNPHLKRLVEADDGAYETDAARPPKGVTTTAARGKKKTSAPSASSSSSEQEQSESEFVKRAKPPFVTQLIDQLEMDQVLVFCRTNLDCDLLETYLLKKKYACCVLAGGRDMRERRRSLDAFKAGEVRVMICTDVAARGIDVSGLPFVVNVTLPDTEENYVHRTGRVGRADKVGLAISLVAAVPEYVWFCQKGKKPPQANTDLYENGGNCIWYDEPRLLQAVEARIGTTITKLAANDDLALPKDLQALTFGDDVGGDEKKKEPPSVGHVARLASDVDQLVALETAAQKSFFSLQY